MTLSRRTMLASSAMLGLLPWEPAWSAATRSGKKPNIVFIMADDLGYADVSCYGRREYKTPAIDSLAAAGIRFTSAYANSSVCSPTRTALMTGRYQARLRVGLEEPLSNARFGLPPEHPTLPSLLRKVGYNTALIGKWHLGELPDYDPLKSGYGQFWGLRSGGVDYFTHANTQGERDLWDGGTPIDKAGYLTDLMGDRAVEMIAGFARKSAAFFLSLHFTAPHWPWEGPEGKAESDRLAATGKPTAIMHYDGGTMAIYAKMVTRMDYQIGRVLAAVKAAGIEKDTIVIFTSDNGGERFADTWPFSGRKTELLEGGIRVPAIVRWPARVAAGTTSDQAIATMDWLPTLLAAAGGRPDPRFPSDGIDLAEVLSGGSSGPRTLFWRYKMYDQQACREGDYKYLSMNGHAFLFNVVEDPLERANLMNRLPAKFADLKAKYDAWSATMLPLSADVTSGVVKSATNADRYSNQ